MMKYILLTGCLLLAGVAGFSADAVTGSASEGAAPATATESKFSGKVVETMNAGDYTYVLVETGKSKNWAAAPRFQVKVGDTALVNASMPMPKYHSKILNRDFDVVYFTDRVTVNGVEGGSAGQPPQLPKDHPPINGASGGTGLPKDHPAIGASAPKLNMDLSRIKKAEGGKTVAEVFAEKSKLSGKPVKIRGKVVKFNPNIMGKNWLHLRDGTGQEGSNDLLVTSDSEAKLGEVVVASGVVAINKDFGANYKYPVMIENAKLAPEKAP